MVGTSQIHVGKVVSVPDIDVDIPSAAGTFPSKSHTRNEFVNVRIFVINSSTVQVWLITGPQLSGQRPRYTITVIQREVIKCRKPERVVNLKTSLFTFFAPNKSSPPKQPQVLTLISNHSVCVRERERERERLSLYVCVRAFVHTCVWMRTYVHPCIRVFIYVFIRAYVFMTKRLHVRVLAFACMKHANTELEGTVFPQQSCHSVMTLISCFFLTALLWAFVKHSGHGVVSEFFPL